MASRQFIEERLQKAKESLEKKSSTLARHQKALDKLTKKAIESTPFTSYEEAYENRMENGRCREDYWFWIDVRNKREDIERTEDAIEEIKQRIEKYEEELKIMAEKEASRNVEAIIKFLEMWKERAKEWHMKRIRAYFDERALVDSLRNQEGYEAARKQFDENCKGKFRKVEKTLPNGLKYMKSEKYEDGKYEVIAQYMMKTIEEAEAALDDDLARECERKYDDIINRTNKVVGEITDASGLSVDSRCNLNGIVYGTKGTATVNTIGAGGYNIQCFHFRTLIHAVK